MFKKEVSEEFKKRQIRIEINNLFILVEISKQEAIKKLEEIDMLITTILLEAEAKIPLTKIWEWSPVLQMKEQIFLYWNHIYNAIKKRTQPDESFLSFIVNHIEDKSEIYQGNSHRKAGIQYKIAKENLNKARRQHRENRKQYMEKKLKEAQQKSPKEYKKMMAMINVESMRKMYQKFNFNKDNAKQRIFSLQIEQQDGNFRISNKREEIEEELHRYIKLHFQQPKADECPLMLDKYLDLFGHDLNTEFADNFILTRQLSFPFSLSQLETSIFQELKPIGLSNLSTDETISVEEIKNGYRKWKERMLTSPHGRHLGIYKVWQHTSIEEEEYRKKYDAMSEEEKRGTTKLMTEDDFFKIITDMINIALKLQHPLSRWKKVNVLMAPKDQGVSKPARIRYLNQFDSEVNLLQRIVISQRTMENAEQSGDMTDSQWGGWTGWDSILVALSKELTIHLSHAMRQNIIITDFDAASCFDCIITSMLYLSYNKFYPYSRTLKFLAKALLQHEYHPQSGYSPSPKYNTHSEENPHCGPNQGSTDGSPGCILVGNTQLKVYEASVNGVDFICPTGEYAWNIKVGQFVDDTNMYHAAETDQR